ncbi:MAG: c-type cytochrome domain-containing protein [Bacteroidota bacterium]|nr:c-type cytochrome domain-containing protein [Bacteroidota bacterium]
MEYTLEILKYVGKFHPLVLHLPIGSLLMTFLLLVVSRYQKAGLKKAIRIGVDFSFAGALMAALMGCLLSLDEAYDFNSLKFHFWAGIITLILSFSLCILHRMKGKENLFFGSYLVTLLALTVTGHKGGQITHGEDYLSTADLFEEPIMVVQKDSVDYYKEVVHLIFEDKCVSCHNSNKSKGELRLDRYDLMLNGGERGSMFDAQNPNESRLIRYINLPKEDKLHMPPKNKSQLSEKEKWLLTDWVTSSAYLKEGKVSLLKNEDLKSNVLSFLGAEKQVSAASRGDLAKLLATGFRIKPNALHDNLLRIKFMKPSLTSDHLKTLLKVKKQLFELDVSNTNFDDEMATILLDFPRLKHLRLDHTKISDDALSFLKNTALEVLNLCNTKVTHQGVQNLLKVKPPKTIYAWNTAIDRDQQKQLASIAPSLIHFGTADLFSERLNLSPPELHNVNVIFEDTISVVFEKTKVKNINIHYTLDGSEPDENSPVYMAPILLNDSKMLKAKSIKKGWIDSPLFEQMIFKNSNQIIGYKVNNDLDKSFSISHHVNFTFKDNQSVLFDGKKGKRVYRGTSIEDAKTWLGVVEEDLEIEVKLKDADQINYLTLSMLENQDMRTIFPKKIEVYGKSAQGKYKLLNSLDIPVQQNPDERISYFKDFTLALDLNGYDEVKVVGVGHGKFPDAPVYRRLIKRNAWIFADEIIFW